MVWADPGTTSGQLNASLMEVLETLSQTSKVRLYANLIKKVVEAMCNWD